MFFLIEMEYCNDRMCRENKEIGNFLNANDIPF